MGFVFQWEKKVNKEINKKSEIYGILDSDKCYGENKIGKEVSGLIWEEFLQFIGWLGNVLL